MWGGRWATCGSVRPLWKGLDPLDGDALQHHVRLRTVLRIARQGADFVRDVLALYNFAKDRVVAREPWRGCDGDEKLRAVGVRSGVGHGKFAGLVKLVGRAFGFVLKAISGAARASAAGIAALNHEVGDDAVEDGPVVKRAGTLLSAYAVLPIALSLGELHKIGDRLGRFLLEEAAEDVALVGDKRVI